MSNLGSNRLMMIRQYSVPLLTGVVLALLWANMGPVSYQAFLYYEILPGMDFHFLINDVFMVFFFGIAGVEITRSMLPGGALNPLRRAVAPLLATAGGVLGPIAVFVALNVLIGSPDFVRGWGIPTATDIALAWLVARLVFGAKHPAVSFLLLLAVADDAVGLLIIAVFYPDPLAPTEPVWLLLVLAGMLLAWALRRARVRTFWPYILGGGLLAWAGMHNAHLHPALALVFIVPFLPHRPLRKGARQSVASESHRQEHPDALDHILPDRLLEEGNYTPLDDFEHRVKPWVDYGLIAFGLANAGVAFATMSNLTWIVLAALLVGKTAGVFLLGGAAALLGFSLPAGMRAKELLMTGLVAAMGLTVALFVAGVAYVELPLQGAAKMGALFSAAVAPVAIIMGRLLGIKRIDQDPERDQSD